MAEQDLLERAKGEVRERLQELDPLIEERDRLRGALEALEAGEGPKRASGRASRQRGRSTTSRRAGRGERRAQLLELLRAEPGLRPSEAARRMAVNPPRSIRWRGGWRRTESSSVVTARSIREVPRSLSPQVAFQAKVDPDGRPGSVRPTSGERVPKGTGLQNR